MLTIEIIIYKHSRYVIVSPVAKKDGKHAVSFMRRRNVAAHFTSDGVGRLEFYIPTAWTDEKARDYVRQALA